jgi:hypothetical protein
MTVVYVDRKNRERERGDREPVVLCAAGGLVNEISHLLQPLENFSQIAVLGMRFGSVLHHFL